MFSLTTFRLPDVLKAEKLLHFIMTKTDTAQKMKFSIKDFFSKCDQIRSFLLIWSHLLKKSLIEDFIFCGVRQPFCDLIRFWLCSTSL